MAAAAPLTPAAYPRRDRDEPQVRDGDPRGPRPAGDPPPDPGGPRARAARAAGRVATAAGLVTSEGRDRGYGSVTGAGAVTGIVLAGGRSSRFGSDKLAAEVDGGLTLLEASIARRSRRVADGGARRPVPRATTGRCRWPASRSAASRDPEAFERAARRAPGRARGRDRADRPRGRRRHAVDPGAGARRPRPGAARRRTPTGAAVLATRGRLVPLPAALRTGRASDEVGRLVDDGERRLRSLFERLPTRVLDETSSGARSTPSGDTLRDVDRPEDL